MQIKNTESANVRVDQLDNDYSTPAATAERLAGQLRHASKLAAIGDDMTAVYRRLGHAFRHLSDNLHQLAGDTLTQPGGNWVPTPPRLGHVRVGDYVLHSTRGPIRIEHMEADGDELVFVYDTDRRVPVRQCVRVLSEDEAELMREAAARGLVPKMARPGCVEAQAVLDQQAVEDTARAIADERPVVSLIGLDGSTRPATRRQLLDAVQATQDLARSLADR